MNYKYCNFVSSNSNQMEKIVNDYQTFLKEENQKKDVQEVNDGKNIKLFYTLETKKIEIPVGGEASAKYDDKKATFDKIIKRVTRICKFIKIPIPVLKLIETKKYYTFVSYGDHSINYYRENFSNGKNYTDDLSEIEQVKSTLKTKLGGKDKSPWKIVSKDVEVYDLTMATVIKPEDEWIILGTFDYVDNLLKPAPGQQIPIDIVNMEKSECDHCHKNIYRKKTVFIQKIKDNSIIKVGGTCIKNYLGYDYEKVLTYLTDISFISESWDNEGGGGFDEDGGGFGGRWVEDTAPVTEIIRYYIWWYKNRGYMSKSTAEKINIKKMEEWKTQNPDRDMYDGSIKQVTSTSQSVQGDVSYANTPPRISNRDEYSNWREFCDNIYYPRLETISDNDPQIQVVIDYIEENKENNFLFNASNFIKMGYVKTRLIYYISGACSFYFGKLYAEEMKRKAESGVVKKESEWIGVVGEKMKLENLEIINISGFEGEFGWSNVYKLKDKDGNIFTKFGTINPKFVVKKSEKSEKSDNITMEEPDKQEIEDMKNYTYEGVIVGDIISATADIKRHDEYMGKKQTTLGRLSKL